MLPKGRLITVSLSALLILCGLVARDSLLSKRNVSQVAQRSKGLSISLLKWCFGISVNTLQEIAFVLGTYNELKIRKIGKNLPL